MQASESKNCRGFVNTQKDTELIDMNQVQLSLMGIHEKQKSR